MGTRGQSQRIVFVVDTAPHALALESAALARTQPSTSRQSNSSPSSAFDEIFDEAWHFDTLLLCIVRLLTVATQRYRHVEWAYKFFDSRLSPGTHRTSPFTEVRAPNVSAFGTEFRRAAAAAARRPIPPAAVPQGQAVKSLQLSLAEVLSEAPWDAVYLDSHESDSPEQASKDGKNLAIVVGPCCGRRRDVAAFFGYPGSAEELALLPMPGDADAANAAAEARTAFAAVLDRFLETAGLCAQFAKRDIALQFVETGGALESLRKGLDVDALAHEPSARRDFLIVEGWQALRRIAERFNGTVVRLEDVISGADTTPLSVILAVPAVDTSEIIANASRGSLYFRVDSGALVAAAEIEMGDAVGVDRMQSGLAAGAAFSLHTRAFVPISSVRPDTLPPGATTAVLWARTPDSASDLRAGDARRLSEQAAHGAWWGGLLLYMARARLALVCDLFSGEDSTHSHFTIITPCGTSSVALAWNVVRSWSDIAIPAEVPSDSAPRRRRSSRLRSSGSGSTSSDRGESSLAGNRPSSNGATLLPNDSACSLSMHIPREEEPDGKGTSGIRAPAAVRARHQAVGSSSSGGAGTSSSTARAPEMDSCFNPYADALLGQTALDDAHLLCGALGAKFSRSTLRSSSIQSLSSPSSGAAVFASASPAWNSGGERVFPGDGHLDVPPSLTALFEREIALASSALTVGDLDAYARGCAPDRLVSAMRELATNPFEHDKPVLLGSSTEADEPQSLRDRLDKEYRVYAFQRLSARAKSTRLEERDDDRGKQRAENAGTSSADSAHGGADAPIDLEAEDAVKRCAEAVDAAMVGKCPCLDAVCVEVRHLLRRAKDRKSARKLAQQNLWRAPASIAQYFREQVRAGHPVLADVRERTLQVQVLLRFEVFRFKCEDITETVVDPLPEKLVNRMGMLLDTLSLSFDGSEGHQRASAFLAGPVADQYAKQFPKTISQLCDRMSIPLPGSVKIFIMKSGNTVAPSAAVESSAAARALPPSTSIDEDGFARPALPEPRAFARPASSLGGKDAKKRKGAVARISNVDPGSLNHFTMKLSNKRFLFREVKVDKATPESSDAHSKRAKRRVRPDVDLRTTGGANSGFRFAQRDFPPSSPHSPPSGQQIRSVFVQETPDQSHKHDRAASGTLSPRKRKGGANVVPETPNVSRARRLLVIPETPEAISRRRKHGGERK